MQTLISKTPLEAPQKEAGFTLVELAIVLVIIGLIVGGVLVGTDLIRSAEIRSTVSQIESYNAAVNTFRGRFNGVPGDIRNAQEFFNTTDWPNMTNGNGNRSLDACTAVTAATGVCTAANLVQYSPTAATPHHMGGEVAQFWHHLSAAELVSGSYDGLGYNTGDTTSGDIETSFPRSRMDAGGIGVYGEGANNFYQIGVTRDATPNANYTSANALSPEQSFNLDQKMDDGRPGAGAVRAMGGVEPNTLPSGTELNFASNLNACILEATLTTASTYALQNQGLACQLRFKMN